MRKGTVAAAVAIAIFSLNASAQTPPRSIKMQSTWPASNTLQEHFKMFAERVDKLTQGSVKIETMAAGQIVPPFEVLDATHKKVLDGWHAIAYYWVGKSPAAALFAAQRGVIDCAEWVGGVEDLRLGLHQVFKYHYTPGMHENNSIGELGFNLDTWKAFSPHQQEAVNSAVKDTFITWITRWQKQNADA